MKPIFIITIDTEGDNLWSRPERLTTENRRFIPRFQQLCEEYGFKPTYLTDYEMAADAEFVTMATGWVGRGAAEIGLHIHAWDTPPYDERFGSRFDHIYQYELPDNLLHAKTMSVHNLLCNQFGVAPVSHRAGRWGIDSRVARGLAEMGYTVDCSVAPGESYTRHKGLPKGHGGPDFTGYPLMPYRLDLSDISRAGSSKLLEVPATVIPNYSPLLTELHHRVYSNVLGKAIRFIAGVPFLWLRPTGRNLDALLHVVDLGIERDLPVLEFVLHSSELMPAGSPRFKNREEIEILYTHLNQLFQKVRSAGICGMTLAE